MVVYLFIVIEQFDLIVTYTSHLKSRRYKLTTKALLKGTQVSTTQRTSLVVLVVTND